MGLHRFQAILSAGRQMAGEWFAEHARVQLSCGTHCSSRPAWLAWVRHCTPTDLLSAHSGDGVHLQSSGAAQTAAAPASEADAESADMQPFVVLWARDNSAARRGMLALQFEQVRGAVHVLLERSLLPQLERCARAQDDVEVQLREATSQSDGGGAASSESASTDAPSQQGFDAFTADLGTLRPYECWATLRVLSGAAREELARKRAADGAAEDAIARARLDELSRRLLELDPSSKLHVSPGEKPGQYSLDEVQLAGHKLSWGFVVDRFSDPGQILRLLSMMTCQCC
mmetsp:Transcript_10961/g.21301  ORF Transcript_10961/g.21301 Transcript_10961/m.21301 type:complete len:287 (-) Transcript_10961:213-1073(-)